MIGDSMTITLKGVPPSLNAFAGRQNVWEYRRTKALWTQAVYAHCMACTDRPKEPYKKAVVEIKYFFPDKRRRDPDNYAPKFILDGLTKAKVIKDDSFDCLKLILSGGCDRGEVRTEVTVTRSEDDFNGKGK